MQNPKERERDRREDQDKNGGEREQASCQGPSHIVETWLEYRNVCIGGKGCGLGRTFKPDEEFRLYPESGEKS